MKLSHQSKRRVLCFNLPCFLSVFFSLLPPSPRPSLFSPSLRVILLICSSLFCATHTVVLLAMPRILRWVESKHPSPLPATLPTFVPLLPPLLHDSHQHAFQVGTRSFVILLFCLLLCTIVHSPPFFSVVLWGAYFVVYFQMHREVIMCWEMWSEWRKWQQPTGSSVFGVEREEKISQKSEAGQLSSNFVFS